MRGSGQSLPLLVRKAALPRSLKAFGVTGILIPRPKKKKTATASSTPTCGSPPPPLTEVIFTAPTSGGAGVMPSFLSFIPATAFLPELVREFGQIRTRLRSPRCHSEPQLVQDACQIFRDWMRRDFTTSFSLKALYDAGKALTELYKAQLMSKVQYKSFLNFFENLQALRDQHQRAERASNRVKCYKGKHIRTSTTFQQLVEEGSSMEVSKIGGAVFHFEG